MSFSEENEELQERAESQQMLKNWCAGEEGVVYLQCEECNVQWTDWFPAFADNQ